MKKQNTGKSSFSHNDVMYEFWYDGRMDMANDNYENININTVAARNIFAISVINFINSSFNSSIIYNGLHIPKFYNYEGDKINFVYNDDDFYSLLGAIKDYGLSDELEYRVQQYTNSCDGYIALYNEDELKADKDLYISVILETLFNSDCVQNEYEQHYDYNCIYEKLEDAVTYYDSLEEVNNVIN